jgi:hypothetical protein
MSPLPDPTYCRLTMIIKNEFLHINSIIINVDNYSLYSSEMGFMHELTGKTSRHIPPSYQQLGNNFGPPAPFSHEPKLTGKPK